MRVLVRTTGINNKGYPDDVEVVDVETGEQLQGVTSLSFLAGPAGSTLTIKLHDFDVDLNHEVKEEKVSKEVVFDCNAMLGTPTLLLGKYESIIDPDTGHVSVIFIPDVSICDGE